MQKLLVGVLIALSGLIVGASVVFMVVENLNPLQAFYFAVVTVTTVGYGDIHPKTSFGMILCVIMILGGVGLFTGGVGLIANAIISKRDREAAEAKTNLLLELFVSTVGLGLLDRFTACNREAGRLSKKLNRFDLSSEAGLKQAKKALARTDFAIDLQKLDADEWITFLDSNSQVFLVLLSNPAVSEGLRVTSVLRRAYGLRLVLKVFTDPAPTYASDELRSQLESMYRDLTHLWLDYMASMLKEYPASAGQLASLNPFKSRES